MFSLESHHRGDSNEYTQYTIFNMNKKNTINHPKSAATGFFSKGLKNEFDTAVVNELSVFEPLKFYCIVCKCIVWLRPESNSVLQRFYRRLSSANYSRTSVARTLMARFPWLFRTRS